MNNNNNINNNSYNNAQYTVISQEDLDKERLPLINNNHHINNLDRISCYSCESSNGDSDTDSINCGGCCGDDSSVNSSDGQAMRTIKSIFYNNLFCKICLLLVCIIAIYTLIAIRCNGMGFDGCKQ